VEANGARWPSRSSKSVAACASGRAEFDSQALPPFDSAAVPAATLLMAGRVGMALLFNHSEKRVGVAQILEHDIRTSRAESRNIEAPGCHRD
jgi:hypothetical protein